MQTFPNTCVHMYTQTHAFTHVTTLHTSIYTTIGTLIHITDRKTHTIVHCIRLDTSRPLLSGVRTLSLHYEQERYLAFADLHLFFKYTELTNYCL